MSNFAPVALFVYCRPFHTQKVLDALVKNPEAPSTDLHVFIDGAKSDREIQLVNEVKSLVTGIAGFASVTVHTSDKNLGLSKSIIRGVDLMLEAFDRLIVLEDDLVVSPTFLNYMNESLNNYESEDLIASIHGYCYPHASVLPETFFIRGSDCWGWGTWKRAWMHFNPDGNELLDSILSSPLVDKFDFAGTGDFVGLLKKQVRGDVDSWAIRWYASTFLDGMFTLYPNKSLVQNIGNDGSGRHSGLSSRYDVDLDSEIRSWEKIDIVDSATARKEFELFFSGTFPPDGRGKIHKSLLKMLQKTAKLLPFEFRQGLLRSIPTGVRKFLT